jgi:CRP-like cAMP-binding protein
VVGARISSTRDRPRHVANQLRRSMLISPRNGGARQRLGNRLLAHLPAAEQQRFIALCGSVELTFGQVLARPDVRIADVYFPLTAFVSLIAPAGMHATLEVGLIGAEGMLGATVALGTQAAPLHALVQGAGSALHISAKLFQRELDARPTLRQLLLRYCYVTLRQVSQTAACTHYHSLAARLARWLLMTQDRVSTGSLHLTHDFLGRMLGVRRVGVTEAAGVLQARRLIIYRRGEIIVVNRRGLEAASCDCYARDKRLYDRVLGGAHRRAGARQRTAA